MASKKRFAASAEKNKDPILGVLKKYVRSGEGEQRCLEIASGTGQHIVHYAAAFPRITFQPSECTETNLSSIQEYLTDSNLTNILSPVNVDITSSIDQWNLIHPHYDFLINVNMIHISPWQCTLELFKKANQLLEKDGLLFTYGPYSDRGVISPESNINFNNYLIETNAEWGLRDIEDLKTVASQNNFLLDAIEEMPSNNKTLIWKKLN